MRGMTNVWLLMYMEEKPTMLIQLSCCTNDDLVVDQQCLARSKKI